ncbi:MAG: hypothetical protein R2932_24690 [Caldilineaceae bacterium]
MAIIGKLWPLLPPTNSLAPMCGRHYKAAVTTLRQPVPLVETHCYFYGDTDVLTDAVDVNVTTGLTTTAINIDLSDDAFSMPPSPAR